MKSIRISPTCIITVADELQQEINVDGKIWRFDFDRHLGPCWLKKNGEPRSCQSPNKRVWEEFSKWFETWNKRQKKQK
jgi:hypothetical protein